MTKTPHGYYGVIIPKYSYYQGFFLYEDSAASRCYLERVRNALGQRLVPDTDQGLLSAICATLVEGARTENKLLLLRVSSAISILTDSKYFMVRGEVYPKGTATEFWRMPPEISSPDAARDCIHSLPDVQLIQGKLLKEAADLVLNDKKKH